MYMKKTVFFLLLLLGLLAPWATQAQDPTPASACSISYDLYDEADDGWNGAAILVYDNQTNALLATWTIENGSSASGMLTVSHGQQIRFVWSEGGWDSECSYYVSDESGEVFSGEGAMNTAVTCTVACPSCPRPMNLAVNYTLGETTATVTWNGPSGASYNFIVDDVTGEDELIYTTVSTTSYTLTELILDNEYAISVQTVCGSDDESELWSALTFTPSAYIEIGEDLESSSALPLSASSNYSLTEQLYTSDELGEAGHILEIGFFNNGGADICTRTINIYMFATEDEEFDADEDYNGTFDQVTSNYLVFSGPVTFSQDEWTYIELDNPFYFDGESNVVIMVDDNTGSEDGYVYFRTFYSSSFLSLTSSNNIDINPTSGTLTGNASGERNQIRIRKGTPPACRKPIGVTVSDVTNESAALSWSGPDNASGWVLQYSTSSNFPENDSDNPTVTSDPLNTNTYAFSNLAGGTTYYVRVKADCGTDDGESDWSNVSFTTDFCAPEDKCTISYLLETPFGYGWGDDVIDVVDVESERILAAWTISEGSQYEGTLSVCDGRSIRFEWESSSYNENWTYTVYDANEQEIFHVNGVTVYDANDNEIGTMEDGGYEYTVNCSSCPYPTGLQANNIGTNSATLTWEGPLTNTPQSYKVRYRVDGGSDDDWNISDPITGTSYTINGLDPLTTYEWEVKSVCDENSESSWSASSFTTLAPSISCEADSWYAISTPTHQEGQSYLTPNTNNTQGLFRLYKYNEQYALWEVASEGWNYRLERGRGYIYRRGDDGSFTFDGIANRGNYSNAQSLTNACADNDLKGFNLIGNPYTHPIYKGSAFLNTGLVSGYYSLDADGSWHAHQDSEPIAMGQGVLVKVSSSVTEPISLSFNDVATPAGSKGTAPCLQFSVEGFGHADVAYAFLSDGEGLNKIGHLEANLPTLSIPVADRRYALAYVGADSKQFDLHFRAAASGRHTLTLSADVRPDYLHLVDRLTGVDIDLLTTGSYTFNATPIDAANRFLVRLAPGDEEPNGIFAFQSGNKIEVEGTGTLQVFDIMGRQLFVRELTTDNTQLSASLFPSTGVYILRLGGKSQKLVIK